MSSSTQTLKNLGSMLEIRRFADDFVIKCDERVGREHDLIWICSCDRHAFPDRVPHRQLAQRKIQFELFCDAWRDAFEFESGFGEQSGPSGEEEANTREALTPTTIRASRYGLGETEGPGFSLSNMSGSFVSLKSPGTVNSPPLIGS